MWNPYSYNPCRVIIACMQQHALSLCVYYDLYVAPPSTYILCTGLSSRNWKTLPKKKFKPEFLYLSETPRAVADRKLSAIINQDRKCKKGGGCGKTTFGQKKLRPKGHRASPVCPFVFNLRLTVRRIEFERTVGDFLCGNFWPWH